MDFLNKAKAIIVPHASTLFIMNNGQAHAIPMRREAEKEKMLTALRFTDSKEVGLLSALKSDEGPTSVIPPTSLEKQAQRRKRARTRMGRKRAKDRCAEKLAMTHQPNQVGRTPPGDKPTQGPTIRRPKGNKDIARLAAGKCHGPRFQRVLECSGISQNGLEPSGIR